MSNRVNERILQSYATPLAGSQIVDSSWVIALILVGTTIALIPVFLLTVYIGLSVKNQIRQLRKPTTITPEPYEAETAQNSSLLFPTTEMLKGGEELKQTDVIFNNENENIINIIWPSNPRQHQKRIKNIHLPSHSEYPEIIKTFKPVPRLKKWQEKGLKRNSLDTIISVFQKLSSNNEPANQTAETNNVVKSYERPTKGLEKCNKEKAIRRNQILPISLQSSHNLFIQDDECKIHFQGISTPPHVQVQNYSNALEDNLSAAGSISSILQDSKISPAASLAGSSSSIDVTTSEIFKLGAPTKNNRISEKDNPRKISLLLPLNHSPPDPAVKFVSEVLTQISKNTETETQITPSELATLLTKTRPPTPIKAEGAMRFSEHVPLFTKISNVDQTMGKSCPKLISRTLLSQSSQLPQDVQTEIGGVQTDVGIGTRRGRGISRDVAIDVDSSSPRSLSVSSVTAIEKKNKNSVKSVKWLPTVKVKKDTLVEDQAKIGARIAKMDWVKQEEELFLDRTAGALAYFSLVNATMQLVSNKDDEICTKDCDCQEPSGSQQTRK